MQLFLFFGTESMIMLEKAVIWVPIGEAARGGVPLIAEHVHIFLVHLERRKLYQWQVPLFKLKAVLN